MSTPKHKRDSNGKFYCPHVKDQEIAKRVPLCSMKGEHRYWIVGNARKRLAAKLFIRQHIPQVVYRAIVNAKTPVLVALAKWLRDNHT